MKLQKTHQQKLGSSNLYPIVDLYFFPSVHLLLQKLYYYMILHFQLHKRLQNSKQKYLEKSLVLSKMQQSRIRKYLIHQDLESQKHLQHPKGLKHP